MTTIADINDDRFAALPVAARAMLAALGDLLGEDPIAIERPAVLPGLQEDALASVLDDVSARGVVARLLGVVALRELRAMLPVAAPLASLVDGREVRSGDGDAWGTPIWEARLWQAVTLTDRGGACAPIADSTVALLCGVVAAIARAHDEGYQWSSKVSQLGVDTGESPSDAGTIPWQTETASGALCAGMDTELRVIDGAGTGERLHAAELDRVANWLHPTAKAESTTSSKSRADDTNEHSQERPRTRIHVDGAQARAHARQAGSRSRDRVDAVIAESQAWTEDAPDDVVAVPPGAKTNSEGRPDSDTPDASTLGALDLVLRHALVARVQRWRHRLVEALARATPRARTATDAPPHMRLLLRLREICDRLLAGAWRVSPLSLMCVTPPMPTAATLPDEAALIRALDPLLVDVDGLLAAHLARAIATAWVDHEQHRIRALTAGNRESLHVRRHALTVRVAVQAAWIAACERAGALQGLLPIARFYRQFATRVGVDEFVNRVRLEQAVYARYGDRQNHVDAELSTFAPLHAYNARCDAVRARSAIARSAQEEWLVARPDYRADGAREMAAACAEALVLRATRRRGSRTDRDDDPGTDGEARSADTDCGRDATP